MLVVSLHQELIKILNTKLTAKKWNSGLLPENKKIILTRSSILSTEFPRNKRDVNLEESPLQHAAANGERRTDEKRKKQTCVQDVICETNSERHPEDGNSCCIAIQWWRNLRPRSLSYNTKPYVRSTGFVATDWMKRADICDLDLIYIYDCPRATRTFSKPILIDDETMISENERKCPKL